MSIRTWLLYLCLLLICFKASSQSPKNTITQIEKKIAASPDDTNKVLLYLSLTDSLVARNSFERSLAITQKAWLLAAQLKYTHGLVISFIRFGGIYEEIKKDYPKAISCYQRAIKIAEMHRSYTDINTTYSCILNMYYYIGDYPSAMGIAQKGMVLAEHHNDKEELAHYNNQLGFIYLKQEKPVESIKYYRQYLNLATQTGAPALVADAYNCLSDAYLLEKNYKAA